MKKLYIIGLLAITGASLTGCDDFLDDNRYPQSVQENNPAFWGVDVNIQNQINYFYEDYVGYGNGSGSGVFYWSTLSDDQAGVPGAGFRTWTFINVPPSSTVWDNAYTEIRRANLLIKGVTAGTLKSDEKPKYLALGRLHRAQQYFELVRAFGDVPLIEEPLEVTSDAELFGPRVDRNKVMDFALADYDYAIANIATQSSKTTFSVDMARAAKIEACLFEASYSKYHKNDLTRADKYYGEVVKEATELMKSYPITDDYAAIYNSLNADLKANPEIIFMKSYEQGVFMHSIMDWTSSSTAVCGITKDAFDAFLFTDGKPASAHTGDSDAGTLTDAGLSIAAQLAARDQRLSAITYPCVMYQGQDYKAANTMAMTSTTGYGVKKFNNFAVDYDDATVANKGYIACPLYWGAEVYLAYAEAKAELGTLDNADVAKALNPLYKRAGLPEVTKADLEAVNDPANNMGVSSLLWEIRRCRRCEFMMDKQIRYWDLVRWHQLELLDTYKHPNIVLGANISNGPATVNKVGNYIDASFGTGRTFTDREYLYPIPANQRALNPNLTQNPGW